jgi:hypothetical protein
MRRRLLVLAALSFAGPGLLAQTHAAKPAAKTAAPVKSVAAPANLTCPSVLGIGAGSKLQFCDVLTGRNPADGVLVHLPPHKGVLTLTFDLHNRHTYSEEQVRSGHGYAAYTATIGVLTADGQLIDRGVVRSEFRTAKDLLDRVRGGAGPGGVKAVAPLGTERIVVDIPENVTEVSLLGEKLTSTTANGTQTFTAPQRPIAAVSNVNVEYQPPPPKPAAKAKKKKATTKQ